MPGPPDEQPALPIVLRARGARDMMTADPQAIEAEASTRDAAALLTRFSAVPVVDRDQRIVGVLSRTDLARAMANARPPFTLELERDPEHTGPTVDYTPEQRVSEVMTSRFCAVSVDASAAEVVRLMVDQAIGRAFVVDDAHLLVGVISSTDVLQRLRVS